MNRDWTRKALAICLAIGCSAPAAPALASEGTLEIIPDPRLVALLLVFFLLLVPVLQRLLLAPLLGVLDEREERIEGTQTRAAALNQEAEGELARHEAAVRAARAEAERAFKATIAAAQAHHAESIDAARSESAQLIESARQELSTLVGEARQVLLTQTRELAREAAGRILGRSLS
jgi:F-type H+-transporting ATPase subunit b